MENMESLKRDSAKAHRASPLDLEAKICLPKLLSTTPNDVPSPFP
jgi:hypothetical protein